MAEDRGSEPLRNNMPAFTTRVQRFLFAVMTIRVVALFWLLNDSEQGDIHIRSIRRLTFSMK